MMPSVFDFIGALQYPWMQKALISAILIGTISALIGVFIILRGVIFLGEAIAHSAFAGAALAILLGMQDPLLLILVFGVSTAIGVNFINEKKIMRDEVVIGVSFTFFMALAVFFIGLMDRFSSSIQAILFGRILLITQRNFILLAVFSVLIIITILGLKKELYFMTFDVDLARASGIPVSKLSYVFMIFVALVIDVSITALGAILVFAMLVTPAAAAYQWSYELNKLLLLSVGFGIISAVGGLLLSFLFDWPSGATMVLLATLIFLGSFVISPKRRRISVAESDYGQVPHFHPDELSQESYQDHLRETTRYGENAMQEEDKE